MSLSTLSSIKGKSILITGAGSGLGAVLSEHLAAEGASVMLADIHDARKEQQLARLSDLGYRVSAVHCDVGFSDDAENAVQKRLLRSERSMC